MRVAGEKMVVIGSGASMQRQVTVDVGCRTGSAAIAGRSKVRVGDAVYELSGVGGQGFGIAAELTVPRPPVCFGRLISRRSASPPKTTSELKS